MTVGDFLTNSLRGYRTHGPIQATSDMLWDAYIGLVWRAVKRRETGVMQTSLCKETVRFRCHQRQDVKRAMTIYGERPVAEWLLEGVNDDTVFWDVGSFHGHYAILAALKGADVTAFEPVLQNSLRLRKNLIENDCEDIVTVAPVALSSRSRDGQLRSNGSETTVTSDGGHDVSLVSGDDRKTTPDVVKIDTEGHEFHVLGGMAETLRDVSRIVVEVHSRKRVPLVRGQLRDAGLTLGTIDTRREQTYVTGTR